MSSMQAATSSCAPLFEGLRNWNALAAGLREPPRRRRRYQADAWDAFLY
jgi:hypothetical protein